MRIAGLCSSAAMMRIFCRMPLEYEEMGACLSESSEKRRSMPSIFFSRGTGGQAAEFANQLQVFPTGQVRVKVGLFRNRPRMAL